MKEKVSILLYNIFRFLLNKLPASAGRYLGGIIAQVAYLITPARREHSRLNLKRALNLNEKESKKLIKKSLQKSGL